MKTYNPKTVTLTMNGERVELHSMGEALRTSQPCPQVTCDGIDPWWKRRSVKPLSITLLTEQARIDELLERLRSLPPAPPPPDACWHSPCGGLLARIQAIDPTAEIDNSIHDSLIIRCAPDKNEEISREILVEAGVWWACYRKVFCAAGWFSCV